MSNEHPIQDRVGRIGKGIARLGVFLQKLINKATLYRLTDDALLLSASMAGVLVGLVIVVYHKVLQFFEFGLHHWVPGVWSNASWTAYLLPIVTALGGLTVGILKHTVFRGVTHSGLNSVSDSIRENGKQLSWRHALHAIVLSSISIATGGGAGREAPTVILGASVSSGFARIGQMDKRHVRVLSAAGAAAAISGIFNAPLGGILFAVECITGELRTRTFLPIVIASVLSTTTVRTLLGNSSLLQAPGLMGVGLIDYPLLALAGVTSAFVAVFYLRSYRRSFKQSERLLGRFHPILRNTLGGLLAGIPLVFFPWLLETSYAPVNKAIAGNMGTIWWQGVLVAAATIFLKPITNAITLYSGGEGGTFAPALKVGALFGFCLGMILSQFVPTNVGLYALVCSAAVLAGTYRAPLTGAILLFEISNNYQLLLPLLFSSVVSLYIVKRMGVATFNPIADFDESNAIAK